MKLGQKFQTLCFAATEGLYEDRFFEEFGTSTTERRLRAMIQNANIKFAAQMLKAPLQAGSYGEGSSDTSVIHRAMALVRSFRGKELPGTFNPALIGQLFRELSPSWFDRTREHVANVWLHARTTVVGILDEIAEEHVCDVCVRRAVDPELEVMQKEMEERLDDYMLEFRRQPITYNHYLTETVQMARNERNLKAARDRLDQLFDSYERLTRSNVDWIANAIAPETESNMDVSAAQDPADYVEAYCKVAPKRAIDEIPAHVNEPAVLSRLPNILDSSRILEMPDQLIEAIGGESEARKRRRESLQAKLEVFSRSSIICKVYSDKTVHDDFGRGDMREDPRTSETLPLAEGDMESTPYIEEETSNMEDKERDPMTSLVLVPETAPAVNGPDARAVFGSPSKKKGKKFAKARSCFEQEVL
ncbi:hypothetical protein LTR95_002458 [Oleoguttula sp. CCFEE 5521]